MVVNQEGAKRRIGQLIQAYGCVPDAPDGPMLPCFDAGELSASILQEIRRAKDYGWSKITIHLDIPDARALAAHLRRV